MTVYLYYRNNRKNLLNGRGDRCRNGADNTKNDQQTKITSGDFY